ncbi:TIGR02281 family clan AA aspartic protease [Pseudomonas daroniae]|uniref:TIGR02281 family clan AA aspartic protease n=1 Tax=Phytopseudomonas daroniae TaxID=2487519 RepID=A0A4Q9QS49_9GAMM|nr:MULTISPECIES: TIGR02281 family clan AA aspartic protease [Pseudomonas]TBU79058.1 TIGR02281 family clan AA aspartic protease [Pseudomonas daroniae]TBU83036.1 TIGR02281 family clan AA aspartic protease [Pseudomonas sp. FRB 228]TBU83951.1 TIGR02281 family clan AA aspartic protease [Pseudomonas daroniae]TBU93129.1 TIGR02281 family clan AA aspartic protease [Pseudomonas daroniae]
MSEQTAGRRAGRVMLVLAWGAGLLLATHFFGKWEDDKNHPNRQPQSVHGSDYVEVRLASSRGGHYLVDGQINGDPVTFLLDTGATQVAIPSQVARSLGLQSGAPVQISTANGRATAHRTRLERLQLGDIVLHDVSALIAPGMDGDEVLLGMSALKQLEFSQRDGTLMLRQSTLQ